MCSSIATFLAKVVRQTGKIGEVTVPPTESQLGVRQKFTTARQNVLALTEEEKAAYATAFKRSPGKYRSLQGYMIAQEYAKL